MIIFKILYLCLYLVRQIYADWISEWMSPVQEQLNESARRSNNGADQKFSNIFEMIPINKGTSEKTRGDKDTILRTNNNAISTNELKMKLENTLQNAKMLAGTLKVQIMEISDQETTLKEAIVNGRSGVTIATISTMGQIPRSYIIRDGEWTICNGVTQTPTINQRSNLLNELLATPRCIGREVSSKHDRCAFNSVIKYEVVPTTRRFEYSEDDYLCLKATFNNTLEQYMSVTQQIVNYTCTNGIIRILHDNIHECGIRVISEYTFYPYRSSKSSGIPIEYCTQKDGSCKLLVAWHVSNTTIENFEFLKDDLSFIKFFLKPKLVEESMDDTV